MKHHPLVENYNAIHDDVERILLEVKETFE
jgi:hypothetical protein